MNCYNGATYLQEALSSVLGQTFQDWEIVFWDNCSTDGSADIFKYYDDSRFRYFHAPHHTTLGEARNLAVQNATGEWLAFLDCDDLWLPNKLENQVDIIRSEGNNLGLVYGRALFFNSDLPPDVELAIKLSNSEGMIALPEGDIFAKLLFDNFVPLLSGLIKRNVFWEVGGINPEYRYAEDYAIFLAVSHRYKVRALQSVCCMYRWHAANNSHSQKELNFFESIKIVTSYDHPLVSEATKRYYMGLAVYNLIRFNIPSFLATLIVEGDLRSLVIAILQRCYRRLTPSKHRYHIGHY
jgi:glycosyltransferase involved in cell wall biosynthesis